MAKYNKFNFSLKNLQITMYGLIYIYIYIYIYQFDLYVKLKLNKIRLNMNIKNKIIKKIFLLSHT